MQRVDIDQSPYLHGNYAPIHEERTFDSLEVIGEIPRDLAGVLARNGANPRFTAEGRHHWFDGDGMIHALTFEDGRARYVNKWVRTRGFDAETEAGHALFKGIMETPDLKNPLGPLKNTANTDLVYHAGNLLALYWLSGSPYMVKVADLSTVGAATYGGALKRGFSAHPKVDPRTGELMWIRFGDRAPFLEYGVISKDGKITNETVVDMPGPRLQHDLAITEHHTILMDLPMHADPELLRAGKVRVKFFRDKPARFGIIPRHGKGTEIRWFEAGPCYVYHTINAWEEGREIVLVGCKIEDPLALDPSNKKHDRPVPILGFQQLTPVLHKWRFNLDTGAVKEEALDDVFTEFPRMDNRVLGVKSSVSYNPRVAREATVMFDGGVKYAHEEGRSVTHAYEKGVYGGELVFAPRVGASAAEDDGYVLTFAANEMTGESWVYVLDAKRFDAPPLARVKIPGRVPTGYHAWWVSAADAAGEDSGALA